MYIFVIARLNCSSDVNVVHEGSPSRMRRVRLISFGITIRPRSSTLLTMPVAFIYFTPFLYSKNVPKTQYLCGFSGCFVLLKSSLVPSKKYDTTKVLIRDELLFLFFVSITLFVEIMSRISNCFFYFKLSCEKGDDGFCHRPLGLIFIYLLLACLALPPQMRLEAHQGPLV